MYCGFMPVLARFKTWQPDHCVEPVWAASVLRSCIAQQCMQAVQLITGDQSTLSHWYVYSGEGKKWTSWAVICCYARQLATTDTLHVVAQSIEVQRFDQLQYWPIGSTFNVTWLLSILCCYWLPNGLSLNQILSTGREETSVAPLH